MGNPFTSGVIVLLIVSLLAGCFTSPADREQEGPVEDLPGPDPFTPRTLYLSPDEALVDEAPEESDSVAAGDFLLRWGAGTGMHPTFNRSFDPYHLEWIAPENATVTLYITTTLPVLPAEGALPDVAVWLGSGHHAPLVGSTQLDGPLLPDEVVEVTFDLPGPAKQPPILALDGISLITTVTMTQLDAHDVRILTGGEHASQVTFETREFHPDDLEGDGDFQIDSENITGEIPLFDRILGPAPEDELNYNDHEIEVADDAQALLVLVYASGGGHTVDMDMVLLDPEGETITWGVTPYAVEVFWLVGKNLEPYRGETLTLRVMNHLGVYMEYDGQIQTG